MTALTVKGQRRAQESVGHWMREADDPGREALRSCESPTKKPKITASAQAQSQRPVE
jgi:hypothetical protein